MSTRLHLLSASPTETAVRPAQGQTPTQAVCMCLELCFFTAPLAPLGAGCLACHKPVSFFSLVVLASLPSPPPGMLLLCYSCEVGREHQHWEEVLPCQRHPAAPCRGASPHLPEKSRPGPLLAQAPRRQVGKWSWQSCGAPLAPCCPSSRAALSSPVPRDSPLGCPCSARSRFPISMSCSFSRRRRRIFLAASLSFLCRWGTDKDCGGCGPSCGYLGSSPGSFVPTGLSSARPCKQNPYSNAL